MPKASNPLVMSILLEASESEVDGVDEAPCSVAPKAITVRVLREPLLGAIAFQGFRP